MLWTMARHKAVEGSDGSEPLLAGGESALARGFELGKKAANKIRRYIDQQEAVDGLFPFLGHERNEQAKCVAVAVLSIAREVALSDDMFQQNPSDPSPEQRAVTHEHTPRHSARIAYRLREAALGSV